MKNRVNYGHHVVVMLDLLGHNTMYQELESLQRKPPGANEELRSKLIEFIQAINGFKESVDIILEGRPKQESPKDASIAERNFYERAASQIIKHQRFSDGIMTYVPLMENEKSIPIASVSSMLSGAGLVMLSQLAKRNPIRGGVGLGGAAEIDDGELFGPAIGYAHRMESKKAVYPRIAVDKNVIDYLDSFSDLTGKKSPEDLYESKMAKLSRSMIVKDKDGVFILDYLGATLWDFFFQGGDQDILELAFEFIKSQKDRYQDDERIFNKYKYVYDYFLNSGRVNA